jgi:hypothetical protein
MATRNYLEAKREGWLGLVDNDEQAYVVLDDLIIIRGGSYRESRGCRTRRVTLGNMCVFELPEMDEII